MRRAQATGRKQSTNGTLSLEAPFKSLETAFPSVLSLRPSESTVGAARRGTGLATATSRPFVGAAIPKQAAPRVVHGGAPRGRPCGASPQFRPISPPAMFLPFGGAGPRSPPPAGPLLATGVLSHGNVGQITYPNSPHAGVARRGVHRPGRSRPRGR